MYACGLRLLEGLRLQVPEIDGQRRLLHIRGGKGGKDRLRADSGRRLGVSARVLAYASGPGVGVSRECSRASTLVAERQSPGPSDDDPARVRRAVKASGVRKRAHVHTLRHSYATHLLEAGVPIVLLQEYSGAFEHRDTAIYTHLTRELRDKAIDPINGLMDVV